VIIKPISRQNSLLPTVTVVGKTEEKLLISKTAFLASDPNVQLSNSFIEDCRKIAALNGINNDLFLLRGYKLQLCATIVTNSRERG